MGFLISWRLDKQLSLTHIQKYTSKHYIIRISEINRENNSDTLSIILLHPHTLVRATNGDVSDAREYLAIEGSLDTTHDRS